MMKIGIISDTHGYIDPKVFTHFAFCDELWHAGDIGNMATVEALEKFKPLKAVYGNIDEHDIRLRFKEDLWFECEGLIIWMTHIGGTPARYSPRINNVLKERQPDIFICGHSHILKIMKDKKHNDMLYINPGAAGKHGFHQIKTLVRFDLHNKRITNMEVIEMGKRGSL